jgi:hypothetical protein
MRSGKDHFRRNHLSLPHRLLKSTILHHYLLREYETTMTEAPARLPPNRPQYTLNSDKYGTSIKIDKWAIISTKKPILNGPEIEAYVHFHLIITSESS